VKITKITWAQAARQRIRIQCKDSRRHWSQ